MSIDLQKSSTFATLALLSFVVSIIPRTSEALEDPRQAGHQAAPTSAPSTMEYLQCHDVLQHYQSPEDDRLITRKPGTVTRGALAETKRDAK